MHLSTPMTELFGIEHPIAQAPMGRSAPPELAAAVSNAGGLGMLGVSWDDQQTTVQKIKATRQLTDRPFAVNLGMMFDQRERLAWCLDAGAPVVSTFWGDASALFPALRAAKVKTLVTVGSVQEAKQSADWGAHVIVAQGVESGGHVRSSISTMVLTPLVVDAVYPLPVIAAGGMADGRGLAAALMLGASGAWIGTRFLATHEAGAHSVYKQLILDAEAQDATMTFLFDKGWPGAQHRVLNNSTMRNWIAAGRPANGLRPGEHDAVATTSAGKAVHRYDDTAPHQQLEGNVEAMALYAGQSVGMVSNICSAAQVVQEILHGAIDTLQRGSAMLAKIQTTRNSP